MNDMDETINIYIDSIRELYQNKDTVISWARYHKDVVNTVEPLAEVESLVKQAVTTARKQRDIESLHALDKALYEMECVLEALERAYMLENSYKQEKEAV